MARQVSVRRHLRNGKPVTGHVRNIKSSRYGKIIKQSISDRSLTGMTSMPINGASGKVIKNKAFYKENDGIHSVTLSRGNFLDGYRYKRDEDGSVRDKDSSEVFWSPKSKKVITHEWTDRHGYGSQARK